VGILLRLVKERLSAQEIHLDITPEATELLVERGFDAALGARPLKRAIQRLLEDPFAEFILRGQLPAGTTIRVRRKDDQLDFEPVPAGSLVPTGGAPEAAAPHA